MQRTRLDGLEGDALRSSLPSASLTPEPHPSVRFVDAVGALHRTKKRKPEVPRNPLPESELYSKLLDYERRVEAVIDARNVEVADALQRVDRMKSVLRVYIWNESHLAVDPRDESHSSFWKLKISGRLLPPKQRPGDVAPEIGDVDRHQGLPFAYFIKSLEVEIDPQNLNGQSTKIKWNKTSDGDEDKEVFEVLRPGEKALPLKISIVFDHQAPVFRLNERFSRLLGFELGTRSKVITEIWNYIKTRNLQTNKDPSVITCDPDLKALFGGVDSIQLSMISGKLNELLTPADKVTLDYTLQLDGYSPAVYDVELELPSNALSRVPLQFFSRQAQDAEVARLDRVIGDAISKIMEHKRRRTFYTGFSQNPVEFVNALLKAQSKEVRLIKRLGERDRYEVETQTEFFKEKWVEDAVVKYFQRRLASGH